MVDGFNRVRRLDGDGVVRTIAGSTRVAGANGLTGDEGPALQAALSNPRQVVALRDGRIWIRDLGGRHLREISRAGVIDTIQTNFDTGVSILVMADGQAKEFNHPYCLMVNAVGDECITRQQGYFSKMVLETDAETALSLFEMAKQSYDKST